MRLSSDFKLESLLFVAFFVTIPIYSPNIVMFRDGLGGNEALMPFFVGAMLITATLVGILFAWLAARRSGNFAFDKRVVIASALAYLIGFALFVATLAFPNFGSPFTAVGAGLLLGASTVELCIAWGAYLAMYNLRQALLALAMMVGMGSVIELLLSTTAIQVGLVVFAVLALVGVAFPCVQAVQGNMVFPDIHIEPASKPAKQQGSFRLSVLRMTQVIGVPFVGLLVFAFIMGVRKFMIFDVIYVETFGGIIGAIMVSPLFFVRSSRPLLPLIYQVLVPLFALVLIVCNSFSEGSVPLWFAAWLSYVFYGVVSVLALAGLCGMTHAREFSATLIYGLTVGCFSAISLLGIVCGSTPLFQDASSGPILLVVSTCYFAFLIAVPLVSAWKRQGIETDDLKPYEAGVEQDGDAVGVSIAKRCDDMAVSHGLSPRETEILGYLGRGHGVVFIAKTLVISESTVRTHVKSIYKKLGVNSREELLGRVNAE